jgi:hypothetical protein
MLVLSDEQPKLFLAIGRMLEHEQEQRYLVPLPADPLPSKSLLVAS